MRMTTLVTPPDTAPDAPDAAVDALLTEAPAPAEAPAPEPPKSASPSPKRASTPAADPEPAAENEARVTYPASAPAETIVYPEEIVPAINPLEGLTLGDLPREMLTGLRSLLDRELSMKGVSAVIKSGPTLLQRATTFPPQPEAAKALGLEAAARALNLKPEEILAFNVHAAQRADGKTYGEQFLVAVDSHGAKHAVVL
jgi:hypothetical protein